MTDAEPKDLTSRSSPSPFTDFQDELGICLRLGTPLALGEVGWMSTYIIDALLIGKLPHSTDAIAASSLGNAIYYGIVFFAIYLLNGLETFVAQAAGCDDLDECVRMLMQAMWVVLIGTPLVMLLTVFSGALLDSLGVPHAIAQGTREYLRVLIWSTAPLMVYMAFRRFLQSLGRVMLISVSLITAGGVNLLFDWIFLYGHWHMPAMGLQGSAWSTLVVRCWMLLVLVPGLLPAFRRMQALPVIQLFRPERDRLNALLRVGWPSAVEFSLELGTSTVLSLLCARLGATMLAAHQVTLDLDAFVYMVPAGLSYAVLIRVGQGAGANNLPLVQRTTRATLLLALAYSGIVSAVFNGGAHRLASFYTNDAHVISTATPLFWLCSVTIFGDAAFAIYAASFTGLGDTRTPLWVSIVCDWVLGMPVAYALAIPMRYGVLGLWLGRAFASIISGLLLSALWHSRMRLEERRPSDYSLAMSFRART